MTLSFKEDHISQIPALMMLEKVGYTYLTPAEAMELRGGNASNVLLEPILREQLAKINTVQVSSQRTTVFSEQNITAGIEALRNLPMAEGYMTASQGMEHEVPTTNEEHWHPSGESSQSRHRNTRDRVPHRHLPCREPY